MKQRGRTSAAALEVASPTVRVERPDAPYDLTDEQSEEWWAVVNRMPADWFPRETHGMLAQYCRHVVASRRVAEMVAALEREVEAEFKKAAEGEGDEKRSRESVVLSAGKMFDRLYKMQEREGRAISSLATKMRISQQATRSSHTQKPPIEPKKPWES